MVKGMAKRAEKNRLLALALSAAILCSIFPGIGVSAGSAGKRGNAADTASRVVTYDVEERVLSGSLFVAEGTPAVEASACTLVITQQEPAYAIGATSVAVDVGGIKIEGEEITVSPEDAGYRISFTKKDAERPRFSQGSILYWHKNAAGEYVYTGNYPAVLEMADRTDNSVLGGKISTDKKYVPERGKASLTAETGYKGEEDKVAYEWFAVGKDGKEEELGETGQECTVEVQKGINRFCCKVAVEGEEYQESLLVEIVGYKKKISLQVGESASINKLIFGEKGGTGAAPVSVQVKESYDKKKFQKKKHKGAYGKCLEWKKENPDKIKLKSYCECGKLEIIMPGQQEGETQICTIRLDGSLVFPDFKFAVNMAKNKKSLTAVFKNVKGFDRIQFAVGKKGKNGKNDRKWTVKKKKAQPTYRIGYTQKNGKRIKEKVFFGRGGLETDFGVKYNPIWKKCNKKVKKAKK